MAAFCNNKDALRFLMNNEFSQIEVDIQDNELWPPLYIALDTRHVNEVDDALVLLILADCSIDVTML